MTGPIRVTTPVSGYMELGVLARLFGVTPATVRRRLRAHGRDLLVYPFDQRLRMVRESDIRLIFQLRPAPRRRRNDAAGEG